MRKLIFATTNQAKVLSLAEALKSIGVEVEQAALDLPEPRSDEVEIIAAEKVRVAFQKLKRPVVALDAGFFIYSLKGFPKAFVNFALETIGIEGILKLLEGKEHQAEFRHALAYLDSSLSEPKVFVDHVIGELTVHPRGTPQPRDWSVLSQYFVPEGQSQTLSEMPDDIYKHWRDNILWPKSYRKEFTDWIGQDWGRRNSFL